MTETKIMVKGLYYACEKNDTMKQKIESSIIISYQIFCEIHNWIILFCSG